jgi:hypothetical protein
VLERQRSEHRDADGDEISDRIVGLWEVVDAVGQELERALGEGIDEESFLGPEQAVDSARGGVGFVGDSANRERSRSAAGDEPLGRGA